MPPGDPVTRIPRGLQYLVSSKPNKFAGRLPSRLPHATTKYVQPRDRVRKWNIRPGDRVRLTSGTPQQKFVNEKNSEEGWRTYEVKQVDLERNRVFLEGINNKKANIIHSLPANYDQLSEGQKTSYNEQKNFVATMRPVHYSNVQLCLEDKGGPDSTFVSRMKTGHTHFNKASQRFDWRRYAAKISGPLDAQAQAEEGSVSIPWPKPEKPYEFPKPDPDLDTANSLTLENSLVLPNVESLIGTDAADLFPQNINAPPPSNPAYPDAYLKALDKPEGYQRNEIDYMDMLMPLYLSEELSPRFAKSKTYKAYRTRREAEESERERAGKQAVAAWEAGGRDKGLKEAMELEAVGLEGVFLKSRTREEVREAAIIEFDVNNESMRKEVNTAVREGKLWDYELSQWVDGPKAEKIEKKRLRNDRKERKILEKLENLRLEEGKNMAVPPELRAA
ncbi:hypothetical protein CI109_106730 [Kwoniella shandongensis]|uniref:Uncharacterized protein n=1 Tax=Kwoniella shandongensis TaxID=1734106 RepID=A0A5M6C6T0_9TREE|nr:uncharacterized protein CI109_001014 [Kwoniella shandongensis]KAA5530834.1 hypothetical protein CI109_001014 [Kwoniella shandongensis]